MDETLFDRAQKEQAVFVTTDKDFFHTVPLAFEQYHGAIVITLRRSNCQELLRRLADVLTALGERNLNHAAWLMTDTRIYSRQQE